MATKIENIVKPIDNYGSSFIADTDIIKYVSYYLGVWCFFYFVYRTS